MEQATNVIRMTSTGPCSATEIEALNNTDQIAADVQCGCLHCNTVSDILEVLENWRLTTSLTTNKKDKIFLTNGWRLHYSKSTYINTS
jgi:hypothetical protein